VCGCLPSIEPDPRNTTPGLVRATQNPLIRSSVDIGQTFGLFKASSFEFGAVELRGLYPVGMAKETISIGVFADNRGAPDPAQPFWTQTYILGETRFSEADTTKPTLAAPNVFVVDRPFKVIEGAVYWLVVSTSASSVSLYAYDGGGLGGDAIVPGEIFLSSTTGTWTPNPTGDLHIVVNPCQ
jgi:hypothetical protein